MRMRKYFCYIDDGKNVYKLAVAAENEDKARALAKRSLYCVPEKIVAIKDVSNEIVISKSRVFDALKHSGFSDDEASFVIGALN